MSDETYNGWTNWDTWNAALWISNDFETYSIALKAVELYSIVLENGGHVIFDPREVFEPILRCCLPCSDARRNGMAWDGINFDMVDWGQIASSYLNEASNMAS